MKRIISKIISILAWLLLVIGIILIFSSYWVADTFELIDMNKLIFHLSTPLEGTGSSMIISYIKDPLVKIIMLTTILAILSKSLSKKRILLEMGIKRINKSIKIPINSILRFFVVILTIGFGLSILDNTSGVREYIKNVNIKSDFIEQHYVDPKNVSIKFPSKKRNIIHIYVESLESTFASYEYGGAFENNYIPNLTNYSNKYITFSNPSKSGFYNSYGTGFTTGALAGQTSGIGIMLPLITNSDMEKNSNLLSGAYTIGDILEKEGYTNEFLLGSIAKFGGKDIIYKNHGNYIIKDYNYAKENKWIPKDYYVWWGYEDSKLYSFAKKELEDLSSKNKPFNLEILTTNTHHVSGYLEDSCKTPYSDQYANVISCTDEQLYEFVEWIKKQDFYKNTTIVITGDHLSMDPNFFDDLGDYRRTNYNVFINSAVSTKNNKNRVFSTNDIYPTVLGSIGVKIEENRLGLGTNLFSNTKTLYEEYGEGYVSNELNKKSDYYNKNILTASNK